jgi:hypothetical protein
MSAGALVKILQITLMRFLYLHCLQLHFNVLRKNLVLTNYSFPGLHNLNWGNDYFAFEILFFSFSAC